MKHRSSIIIALLLSNFFLGFAASAHDTRVFEMRTYFANEGKLDDLLARFRDHTCALFAKHGIENIGYWVPKDNADNTLVYIIAYPSRLDQEVMWRAFLDDPNWKAAYKASTTNGKLVNKVERVFMNATEYSMPIKKIQSDPARLFELRTYTANEGKLNHLDARFSDHTIGLFAKHGIENIAYFHPMADQEGATNTLIYIVAHKDEALRTTAFDGFRKDEDWVVARAASEERAGGGLTIQGGVKSQFLLPTDFSPMR
ncbi:MAG: NIPSNAP family protein [Verrucomicrobia bacterium]|nr:NIPSNAP family protein [Verrucomicrobiota bacterium]